MSVSASTLAPLASQHHLSEYSRIKYGHKGSPVRYAPLAPDVVRALRERQQKYADQVLWWPCAAPTATPAPAATQRPSDVPRAHVKTSESHPINISQVIPPESLVAISSHLTPCKQPCPVLFQVHLPYSLDRITGYPQGPPIPTTLDDHPPSFLLSLKRNLKTHTNVADPLLPIPPSPPNKTPIARHQRPFKLGNLLLSSCPGKKVRLTGPVRGRSAVCRDLDVDLRRLKLMGARCVVCCLDDDELEFLIGASWSGYCQVAHQQGLDVLRIPLPEGLTPTSPKSLDADLDRIIERYTLQGISVLVHCRGGVGRAGLFACCWMLKLGLCGWIETDAMAPPVTFRWNSDTVVRRDTLQLVERVIEVVRRRRSVKAIETLEQVRFLVEYVDYLRTCGRTPSE